jgi:hypothetical protein
MDKQTYWFEPNKEDPDDEQKRAAALIARCAQIEMRQAAWHQLNLWNATLYTNREPPGFRWGAADADAEFWPQNLRSENLIQIIGETMVSKASTSPLKPSLVPHGHSWKTEKAVRVADNFVFGMWRQVQAEDACVQSFRDAFQCGIGLVKGNYNKKTGELTAEPVFFDNIVIDNRECTDRKMPRTYFIRTCVPRATLEAEYPDFKPPMGKVAYVEHREVADNWDIVVEAWRLPDASGKGGWYGKACCGQMLEDEPWKHDWVPLEFFHYNDRNSGFFVPSGVEPLVPYQNRQDELNEAITESQDIRCRPRMTVNANTQINVDQWDNEAGRFLMWSGAGKPEPLIWDTELGELYQERERNWVKAHSAAGVSEMSSGAVMPGQVRLDSSAGVREFRNMEDGRHLRLWTRFEAFRLRVARMFMRILANKKGAKPYKSMYHPGGSRKPGRTIEYEAIKHLTENDYSWTMEPTPLSAMSPAARRELIRDWSSRGLVKEGSEEARRMEGNPNLERIEDLEMASADDIKRHIDLMCEGEFEPPSEFTNLTVGTPMVLATMHRLKTYEDMDPAVLESFAKWLVKAEAIKQKMAAPPPGPASMTPAAPTQGMPGTSAAVANNAFMPMPPQ